MLDVSTVSRLSASNPLAAGTTHVVAQGVEGHGMYVGTYMGGAWNFDVGGYQTYTTPYLGLPQVIRPEGLYVSQQRFGMYRWHVPDPIRFARRLGRVDVQALGW